jgi:hypothetical protein
MAVLLNFREKNTLIIQMEQLLITIFGNLLTVGLGLVVWVVKNKCKHCESECIMPCCNVHARDQTRRGTSRHPESDLEDSGSYVSNSPVQRSRSLENNLAQSRPVHKTDL